MAKENQTLNLYKGEAKTIQVQVLDDTGAPVDVRTKFMTYRIAKSVKSTSILQKLESDMTVTGDDFNFINIPLVHSDTNDRTAGTYYHELRLKDSSSSPEVVVMTGAVILNESLTNTA